MAAPEPVTPPETPAPEETQASNIPDEILKIPAMTALFAGHPGALSFRVKEEGKTPEAKLIAAHADELKSAGLAFYRSLSGSLGVVFNALAVHPEEIKAADKAGKLLEIAPPFSTVNAEISKSGPEAPAFSAPGLTGAAPAPAVNPPQSAQAPMPPPASAVRQTFDARLKNMQGPKSATAGPLAGQGSLLKSILKPVL